MYKIKRFSDILKCNESNTVRGFPSRFRYYKCDGIEGLEKCLLDQPMGSRRITESISNRTDELNDEWLEISDRLYKEGILVKANVGLKDSKISLFLMDIKVLDDISGLGTKGMNELISFADKYNLPTWLLASSNYGSDLDRLVKFYERFGFVYVGDYGDNKEMYRKTR